MLGHSLGHRAYAEQGEAAQFIPTPESLSNHQIPDWFQDAKFGIFIHWGPYSIPAFAVDQSLIPEGGNLYKYMPYAEWYYNSLQFEDGPTAQFHRDTYGDNYSYDRFGEQFNEALDNWDPEEWAQVFKKSGARYVVLVTKHHDGFTLWPSQVSNPNKSNWGTQRDVVGELAEAVRGQGLRFGVYYSGGLDWTFKYKRTESFLDTVANAPGAEEGYVAYANAHYAELIGRYRPDYLWNDIGYPAEAASFEVIANYYNEVSDGLVNDRWLAADSERAQEAIAAVIQQRKQGVEGILPLPPLAYDVRTPEYRAFDKVSPFYWETTRGIGKSFGYNHVETEDDMLSSEEIVHLLTQATAYNGSVLLNVGPRGDATLDPNQVRRLVEVGEWMKVYGQYLQDTRATALPVSEVDGIRVGAVENDEELIIHLLDTPQNTTITIDLGEHLSMGTSQLIGGKEDDVVRTGKSIVVSPAEWPELPTQIIRVQKA